MSRRDADVWRSRALPVTGSARSSFAVVVVGDQKVGVVFRERDLP